LLLIIFFKKLKNYFSIKKNRFLLNLKALIIILLIKGLFKNCLKGDKKKAKVYYDINILKLIILIFLILK